MMIFHVTVCPRWRGRAQVVTWGCGCGSGACGSGVTGCEGTGVVSGEVRGDDGGVVGGVK
jgi:hypothetical protein